MMNLHRQNNKRGFLGWRISVAIVAVLVLFAVDVVMGGVIRGALRTIPAFLFEATTHLPSGAFWQSQSQLARENGDLKNQLARANERAAFAVSVQEENMQLRNLVHLATSTKGIAEPILSSFSTSPYGTFLIGADGNTQVSEHAQGAGSRSISVGDFVLSPDGFVIGKVSEVSGSTALVTMLFSHDTAIEASVGSTTVILTGRSTGNADAQVARGISIATGTVVAAKGALNRPIGIVGTVLSNPANAYSILEIYLPVDLSAVRYVYVVPR